MARLMDDVSNRGVYSMAPILRVHTILLCVWVLLSLVGCDSKREDTQGVSELFDAIFAQDMEAVKALCQGGVDVNGKSQEDGLRPLDRAAGRDGGQEIVMVLIT